MGMEAFLPAIMTVASSVMGAMSKSGQGDAMVLAAQRKKSADDFAAAQLDQNAGQAFAASQRTAIGEGRKEDVAIRDVMAHFSAGGPISAGQLSQIAMLQAQKAYNLSSIYATGKSNEELMRAQATAKRYGGDLAVSDANAARGSYSLAAGADLFKGAASLYSRLGESGDPAKQKTVNPIADLYG